MAEQVSERKLVREAAVLAQEDLFFLSERILGLKYDADPRLEHEIRPYYNWLDRPRPENLPAKVPWRRFWSSPRYTIKTYGLCTWLVANIIRNPNINIVYQSQEKQMAIDSVLLIRNWLETDNLVRLYGTFKSEHWQKDEFTVAQRWATRKDPTIRALGLENPLQSRRCDIMVWDDLIGETNCNDDGIIKVEKRLSASIPLIRPGGIGLYVCTRWSIFDPSTEGFTVSGFPGILRQWKMHDPRTGPPPWDCPGPRGWFGAFAQAGDETFYPHAVEGEPLYPSVLPEEKIEHDRRTMTHGFFASQILNNPIEEEGQIFEALPEDQYFDVYDSDGNRSTELRNCVFYMSIDPNSGKSKVPGGDDTAIAVIGIKWIEESGLFQVYVVEWKGGRWDEVRLQAEIFNSVKEWTPLRIYIEDNIGKAYLVNPLRRRAAELGIHLPLDPKPSSLYGTGKKDARIEQLQPLYTYRRIFHARHLRNSKAEEQLLRWRKNGIGHDDYPDALASAILQATANSGRGPAKKGSGRVFSIAGPTIYPNIGV